MEELKKFQSSTFDTIARRRLVEDQETVHEKVVDLVDEILLIERDEVLLAAI